MELFGPQYEKISSTDTQIRWLPVVLRETTPTETQGTIEKLELLNVLQVGYCVNRPIINLKMEAKFFSETVVRNY